MKTIQTIFQKTVLTVVVCPAVNRAVCYCYSYPWVIKNDVRGMFLDKVPVISGEKYYWIVITKDAAGNSAGSGVYWFTVN